MYIDLFYDCPDAPIDVYIDYVKQISVILFYMHLVSSTILNQLMVK